MTHTDAPRGESPALIARGDAEGPEEKIHPQSIIQCDSTITVDGDETVSTTVSFPEAESNGHDASDDTCAPEGDGGVGIELLPDTGGLSPLTLSAAGLALIGAVVTAFGLRAARRS